MMLLQATLNLEKDYKTFYCFLAIVNLSLMVESRNSLTAEPFRILKIFLLCLYVFQFPLLDFIIWKIW